MAAAAPVEDHFGRALYFQRVGDFDSALAQYRVLLEQNEASAQVHNNVGLLYQDHNQLDDAVKQFQRAIAIDPRSAGSHYNLAVVADENGDAAEAIEHYRAFLRLGAVAHGELVGAVRQRLSALGG